MNHFKFYPGDYLRDTGELTMTEHGAYMLMLLHHYSTRRPLPEPPLLYRMLRVYKPTEKAAVDKVLTLFWNRNEAGFYHKRAQQDFLIYEQRSETNRLIALEREATKRATNRGGKKHESLHETSTSSIQKPDKKEDLEATAEVRSSSLNPDIDPPVDTPRPPFAKNANGGGDGGKCENGTGHKTPDSNPETPPSESPEKPARKKPRTRLPFTELPDLWHQDATRVLQERGLLTVTSIERLWAEFVDYWTSGKNRDPFASDWRAVWRNRCRTFDPPKTGNGSAAWHNDRQSRVDRHLAEIHASRKNEPEED